MILNVQRITSHAANTVAAASQTEALNLLLSGLTPNAVTIGDTPLIWPSLQKYVNDNHHVGIETASSQFACDDAPCPQFLWRHPTPIPAEHTGFAAMSSPITVGGLESDEFILYLALFADDTHTVRIDMIDADAFTILPSETASTTLMADSITCSTEALTDTKPPCNGQSLRYYTIPVVPLALPLSRKIRFVLSFGVTHDVPHGSINTVGFAFAADLYKVAIPA